MTVYFYHTQDTRWILDQWKQGLFPAHLLYGATHLPQLGVEVIPHLYPIEPPNRRLRLMLLTLWRIVKCRRHYDAVYATSFRGLELVILLRALHLWRKPIVLWHHQPVRRASNPLREAFSRLFYRGIDHMIFFSQPLVDESLKSGKARPEHMHVVHWGADLDFYHSIATDSSLFTLHSSRPFISTGKEMRDMHTLVEAFRHTGQPLQIHVSDHAGEIDYTRVLGSIDMPENVGVHIHSRLMIGELARIVARSGCVCICCRPTNYTVGLTTLVEALALGLPIISTRNTTFPFDIDREGVGITVGYEDVDGWVEAIDRIAANPDEARAMGARALALARRTFNLNQTTKEVCSILKQLPTA